MTFFYKNVISDVLDFITFTGRPSWQLQWLGSVVVGRRTCDREMGVRLPAGTLSGNLGQLSLPSLWGR